MNQGTAQTAAKWWADQLRGNAKLDNGDDSRTGGMTFLLATLVQATEKESQNSEQVDAFEQALTDLLVQRDDYLHLGVDYHPDRLLSEAAEQADLDLGMTTLPWKTIMWIDGDSVRVACGYGAEAVDVPLLESA